MTEGAWAPRTYGLGAEPQLNSGKCSGKRSVPASDIQVSAGASSIAGLGCSSLTESGITRRDPRACYELDASIRARSAASVSAFLAGSTAR